MNDLAVSTVTGAAVTFGSDDRGFVYAIARRIVGNAEEADDVTQDTLLVAFRNRHAFRGESRYRTWLYRIAYTTAIGYLRRRARSREALAVDPSIAPVQVSDEPSAEDRLMAAEATTRVRAALEDLAPPYRDVLVARLEATEPEVASRLGISIPNVKVRAHRARRMLRDALVEVR